MNIQESLKFQRELKKYSYDMLSKITGIAKSTLQRYETGTTTKIPMDAINKIEKALNLPKGKLMGWDEIKEDNEPKSLDEQLDGLSIALWGEVKEMTEGQKQDILDYIRFKKHQRGE